MANSNIPAIKAFKQPILDELNINWGGSTFWRDIIEPVANRLGISAADRTIISKQDKQDPFPIYVLRLRHASYALSTTGKLDRKRGREGIWTALARKA